VKKRGKIDKQLNGLYHQGEDLTRKEKRVILPKARGGRGSAAEKMAIAFTKSCENGSVKKAEQSRVGKRYEILRKKWYRNSLNDKISSPLIQEKSFPI